ncbi:UNVERIFIED_CONTAM: protein trichome birefringence-like 23 [Sesamum radiatum]|uniref:Protein trichome birefringence-like 23 n=1 Tax=Sesamum radiatum TaxID=300843 RepID=A0AAW2MGK2_SESRA
MARKMVYDWKSWWRAVQKNNYFVIKLGVSVLLVGLAFRLLYDRSSDLSPVPDAPFLENTRISAPPVVSVDSQENTDQSTTQEYGTEPSDSEGKCNPFIGDWVPYEGEPLYSNVSCSIIEDHQNCMKNGRPDTDYLYWRWNPRGCELPRFDPTRFLELMRNKSWAFIGDSISRNHVQSFLCILSTYKSLDYMIIAAGKWFIKTAIYYEKDTILGCHYCPKRNLTELGFNFAYRKVIRNVFDYIISSNHKGMIFYRTTTPDHFEGGEWFSGGTCKRKEPAKEGEFELNELNKILRDIELDEFEKASAKALEKRVNLKLLDVTRLSLLRPDGHPGPYRFFQPFAKDKNATMINDCLHWCLPGPIDTWNDLLMEMVVNG